MTSNPYGFTPADFERMANYQPPAHHAAMFELGYGAIWVNDTQSLVWTWPHPQKLRSPVADAVAREIHEAAGDDVFTMFCLLCGWRRAGDGWWEKGFSRISPETAAGIYEKRKLAIPF